MLKCFVFIKIFIQTVLSRVNKVSKILYKKCMSTEKVRKYKKKMSKKTAQYFNTFIIAKPAKTQKSTTILKFKAM